MNSSVMTRGTRRYSYVFTTYVIYVRLHDFVPTMANRIALYVEVALAHPLPLVLLSGGAIPKHFAILDTLPRLVIVLFRHTISIAIDQYLVFMMTWRVNHSTFCTH